MNDHICSDHLTCSLDHTPSIIRMLHEQNCFHKLDGDGWAVGEVTFDEVADLEFTGSRVCDAVHRWQKMHPELLADGHFGEVSHYTSQEKLGRMCGCALYMRRPAAGLPRWGDDCFKGITTAFDATGMRHNLGAKFPSGVWDEGNAIISAACGAVLSQVPMSDSPMIRAIMGGMGSGTLAWSFLVSSGCSDRIRQEYNRVRTWGYHDFLWVLIHELLHALGIGHTGVAGQVMNPYYSPSLSAFGSWDKSQLVKRYGPPVAVDDPPDDPPPPPSDWHCPVQIDGNIMTVEHPDGTSEKVDMWKRGIVEI